jgi:SAM-dependent methyltransferase
MKTLLIGAGRRREQIVVVPGDPPYLGTTGFEGEVVTLDINPDHKPDILWDLNLQPIHHGDDKIPDNTFDAIHAYEVLEHVGRQGDYHAFFAEFAEYYRILKPGGLLVGTCPKWDNEWAWADPSHTRVITFGTLSFLSQAEYTRQIGRTPMTDFRYLWKGDFQMRQRADTSNGGIFFVMEAVKPSRVKQ